MRALEFPTLSAPALPRPVLPLTMLAACILVLAPSLAFAQPNLDAADPQAPTAPLPYAGLRPPSPVPEAPAPSWRQAHEAVAQFPRGHADLLAWEAEAAKAAKPTSAGTSLAPALGAPSGHANHGGPRGPAAEPRSAAQPHTSMHQMHQMHQMQPMQPMQSHAYPMHDVHHPRNEGGKP